MTDQSRNQDNSEKAAFPDDAPTIADGEKKLVSPDEPTMFPGDTGDTRSGEPQSDPEISPDYTKSRDDEGRALPKEIGGYQITRVLGTGGMSIVYAALQKQPRRPVALKVMKLEISADRALRRFKREVEILGRLNHPCIAQVFDAGTHDDGTGARPFFVMEYVPSAKTLIEYANDKNLSLDEKLKLFVKVCAAIEHGHRNKIVHRDLKPSNILIDPSGMPKIIDFGVARAMELDVSSQTMQTEEGRLVGTIQYMSPEQVNAQLTDIDSRSDVYSMGVLLYKLLTGRHPYNLEGLPVYTAVQIICDVTPPLPSELRSELAGDFETIMLKSLEKDRVRRYKSAGSFGRDVVRFLANKPINARRASLGYRTKLLLKRHRVLFVASVAVLVVIAAATTTILLTLMNANEQQIQLQQQIDRQTNPGTASVAPTPSGEPREAYVLDDHSAAISSLRFDPAGKMLASGARDFSVMLWDLGSREAKFFFDNHEASAAYLAFSADGSRLVTAASDQSIVLLDVVLGQQVDTFRHECPRIRCLAVSADATRFAVGCDDLTLRIMAFDDRPAVIVRGTTGAFNTAAFDAADSRLIAGSERGTVYLFDVTTGGLQHQYADLADAIIEARFLEDSQHIIAVSDNGNAAIWRLDSADPPRRFSVCTGRVTSVAIDRDGRFLACATRRRIRIRNLSSDAVTDHALDEDLVVRTLAVAPEGDWLAVGDATGAVHMIPVTPP